MGALIANSSASLPLLCTRNRSLETPRWPGIPSGPRGMWRRPSSAAR